MFTSEEIKTKAVEQLKNPKVDAKTKEEIRELLNDLLAKESKLTVSVISSELDSDY